MWILTEGGQLVSLAHVANIETAAFRDRWIVVAHEPGATVDFDDMPIYSEQHVLCNCDDKEHGKRIIARLAASLAQGSRLVVMGDVTYRGVECRKCGELYCDCEELAETA